MFNEYKLTKLRKPQGMKISIFRLALRPSSSQLSTSSIVKKARLLLERHLTVIENEYERTNLMSDFFQSEEFVSNAEKFQN